MRKALFVGPVLVTVFLLVQAGSLEPPGPPAPTMKTIIEVEPRTPIYAADLPLTITSPGSYYLAENISTPGDGVLISADNVTLDLKGFALVGGTGDGIAASTGRKSIVVKNGVVSGWVAGINLTGASHSFVSDIRAISNHRGIEVGNSSFVDRSVIEGASEAVMGIYAANGCVINGCSISDIPYGYGIEAGTKTRILDCTFSGTQTHIYSGDASVVSGCTGHGGESGITLGAHSLVVDCTVRSGTDGHHISVGDNSIIRNSSVTSGTAGGMYAGSGSTIQGCRVSSDTGIVVNGNSLVLNNTCVGTMGPGIAVHGGGNRIEANNVTDGYDAGIKVYDRGNVIIKNSASGNTPDYDIAAGNDVGPIGTAAAATSPFANIQY